jgi:hypothetical protein
MTHWRRVGTAVTLLAVMAIGASSIASAACGDAASGMSPDEHARQVLARHREELLAVPGVVGVGIGRDASSGAPVIRVYTAGVTDEARAMVPNDLEGVPIQLMESGEPRPR